MAKNRRPGTCNTNTLKQGCIPHLDKKLVTLSLKKLVSTSVAN